MKKLVWRVLNNQSLVTRPFERLEKFLFFPFSVLSLFGSVCVDKFKAPCCWWKYCVHINFIFIELYFFNVCWLVMCKSEKEELTVRINYSLKKKKRSKKYNGKLKECVCVCVVRVASDHRTKYQINFKFINKSNYFNDHFISGTVRAEKHRNKKKIIDDAYSIDL